VVVVVLVVDEEVVVLVLVVDDEAVVLVLVVDGEVVVVVLVVDEEVVVLVLVVDDEVVVLVVDDGVVVLVLVVDDEVLVLVVDEEVVVLVAVVDDEVVVLVLVVDDEAVVLVLVDDDVVVEVGAQPHVNVPFSTVAGSAVPFNEATITLDSASATCSPGVHATGPSVSVRTATGPVPAAMSSPERLMTRALTTFAAVTSLAVQVKPAVRSVHVAAVRPDVSWSSSGLSCSTNDRPRTATALSSAIGTWIAVAPGSAQTFGTLSVTVWPSAVRATSADMMPMATAMRPPRARIISSPSSRALP